jgi:hypothetical protein
MGMGGGMKAAVDDACLCPHLLLVCMLPVPVDVPLAAGGSQLPRSKSSDI